jgi:hypothetical protein
MITPIVKEIKREQSERIEWWRQRYVEDTRDKLAFADALRRSARIDNSADRSMDASRR